MGTIQIEYLKNICTHSKGKKPKQLSTSESKLYSIPYINIKSFERGIYDEYTDGVNCNLCEDGDLLMVWDGARAGLTGRAKKGAIGSTLMKIEPTKRLHKEYLFYFLKSIYRKLNTNPRGVGIPHVEPTLLWDSELALPPIPQQQLIVCKLEELFSKLDKGVESLKTLQRQLKVYRQAVLNSTFIIDDKANCSIKDVVGKIQIGPFGSQLHKEDYIENGIPLINPTHIKNGAIIADYSFSILQEKRDSLPNYILEEGDIIMGRRGEMGRCGLVTSKEVGWFCGTGSLYFRPEPSKINSVYLYHFLLSEPVKKYLETNAGGTTMANLNKKIVSEIPIALPSLQEQNKIVEGIESRLSVCNKIEETITNALKEAEALRQSILKQAFEGKLV